jgi:hypothetical protein
MRFALSFVLVAAIGCGSNSNNNQDAGMDAGVDQAPPGPCDIPMQTGCASGQKCIPDFTNVSQAHPDPVGKCVADGTVAAGQPCMVTSGQMDKFINDNCKSGSLCEAFTGDGVDNVPVCTPFCTSNSSCTTAGQKCLGGQFFSSTWGVCLATCTPSLTSAQGSCPTGNSCVGNWQDIAATMSNDTGFFVCKKDGPGSAVAFTDCTADPDCGPGLFCAPVDQNGGVCAPLCGTGHNCPTAPAADGGAITLACSMFANSGGVGTCAVQ